MVTYGWTQYFDWRLEEHWLWEDDSTKGVIDFYGDVYYELVDGDLLVHLVLAEAVPTVIPIDDAGHTKNVVFTHWLTDTETILRIEGYQEGDLGINFYDVGEGVGIDTGQGFTATHYPYWDSTVQTLTNKGQFLAPLDPRPAAAEQPDGPAGGPPPAVTIAGGGDDDVIAAAEASHVSAGGGTDTVTGSPGADVLDGGAGADTLAGGAGRDTYIVDDVGDVVLEQAGGGIDTVIASADFALAANVEHLTLTGSAGAGWGNGLANRIFGNDGANVLDGLGGGDTLYGGLGADLLQGGDGGDGYVYTGGDGDDTIIETGSAGETDTLVLTGFAPGAVNVHRLAASPDDLVLTVAQGGRIVVVGFMASASAGIDEVVFDDGTVWSRDDLDKRAAAAPLLDDEPPQAVDDLYLVAFGPEAVLEAAHLLANDRDLDGGALSIAAVGPATVSSVSLEPDGRLRLTMPAEFEGVTAFSYTVADGQGGFATAEVEVAIIANHGPVATGTVADQSSPEDAAWRFSLPAALFDDADGDRLTFAAIGGDGSALPAWLSFDPASGTFAGTPPAHFHGALDLRVTASDGAASTSVGFRLLVTPANDAPQAVADAGLVARQGTPLVIAAATLLANDTDLDGDSLSLLSVTSGSGGTVALNSAGDVVFTPASGASGPASFTYTLCDGQGPTATATVLLTIEAAAGGVFTRTIADDVLVGTAGADVIEGGGGNDQLSGQGGDDTFKVLGGDAGFDVVDGGTGLDRILGSAWNDVIGIAGLTGIEAIDGGGGNDTLRLTAGADALDLTGVDTTSIELIDAGAGNDRVTGSAAGDVISGGAGDDVLAGGAGDDTFDVLGGADGFDLVLGGTGFDRIQASPYNDVIGLANVAGNLAGVEAIDGGAGSDTLRLTATNDTLDLTGIAVGGIELIEAGAGNDTVTGSASGDVISGGAGDDVLAGGAGDDTFNVLGGAEGFDVVLGGAGFDRQPLQRCDRPRQRRRQPGGRGGDRWRQWQRHAPADRRERHARPHRHRRRRHRADRGRGRQRHRPGSAAGDVISGGAGDDVLAGNAGDDTFNVLGGAEGFDVVLGGAGFDRIQASPYNDVIGLVRLTGVEAIDGGAGSDTIRLTAGNDALDLTGVTVSGIELIDAGGGDDVIAASAAADVLKGGLGNDTFVFAPGFGNDTIADFQLGTASQPVADVIDLSALGLQSFAELQGHMTQVGADTMMALDAETSLRLAGISLSQLQGNDFIL